MLKGHHIMPRISSFIDLLYIFVRNFVHERVGIHLIFQNTYTLILWDEVSFQEARKAIVVTYLHLMEPFFSFLSDVHC